MMMKKLTGIMNDNDYVYNVQIIAWGQGMSA